MAKCLVTGHLGYIGSHLYKDLQVLGHDVIGIDLKSQTSADILKYSGLKEDDEGHFHPYYYDFQPEYIFHLACWPRINYSIEHPVETMRNNVLGGSIVLNFARKCSSVKRVIYSSSSSVIGQGSGPTNPYALQKLVTEMECKIYSELYDLDTVALRYFNVYSEDQAADGPYATAVANWMHYIREGKTPFITGNGEQRRDMVHISDVLDANIFAMQHGGHFGGRHFDVGTGDNISLNELKEIVQKYHNVEFEYREARPGEVLSTRANTEPYKKYDFEACIDLQTGLHRCFNFEVIK